jgi:predicted restriction endonuclease
LEDVVAMIRAHTAAPPQEEIPEKDEQERNAQAAALAPTMVDLVSDESRRPNDFDPANFEDGRTLFVQEIVRRQGQGAFRQEVLKAYQGRCAISGCRLEHVLEAAHIQPYLGPNTNHVTNGLLLRSDLHTLFDLHLIAINPSNWTVVVSGSIRDQEYTRFHGEPVALPKDPSCCPNNRVVMDHLSQLRP